LLRRKAGARPAGWNDTLPDFNPSAALALDQPRMQLGELKVSIGK
jgi:hypothetical protein